MDTVHIPIMVQEVLNGLSIIDNGVYVDGTIGGGGHSYHILASNQTVFLIGFDRDSQAILRSENRLKEFGENRYALHNRSYAEIKDVFQESGIDTVNGIFVDLGYSSDQIDTEVRGFTFQKDQPLDMRYDINQAQTAADIVNFTREKELADLIYIFGEEKYSRKIAQNIVFYRKSKKIETTTQLVRIIEKSVPPFYRNKKIHCATKTFQALRIAVNKEFEHLEKFLPDAIDVLKVGGRLAVLTFHSLEDRIVKQYFKKASKGCICPPDFPKCICDNKALIKIINKKVLIPSSDEVQNNPRSRSAKLRIIQRI